jgi:hypothetical protein
MKGGRLSSIKLELSEMKSKQVTNRESFQAFNEAGVSLVPGLAVPRTTVPELSINHTELVNFIQAIISTGTISVGKRK